MIKIVAQKFYVIDTMFEKVVREHKQDFVQMLRSKAYRLRNLFNQVSYLGNFELWDFTWRGTKQKM